MTRSTLAREADAKDETVDRCTYTNYFVTELLYDCGNQHGRLRIERALGRLQRTDCKSLYDAVISENPSLTEKRTMIAVRSILDFLREDDCRWVPTDVMWADILTQEDMQLCVSCQHWLRKPYVMLVDEREKHKCEILTSDQSVLLSCIT